MENHKFGKGKVMEFLFQDFVGNLYILSAKLADLKCEVINVKYLRKYLKQQSGQNCLQKGMWIVTIQSVIPGTNSHLKKNQSTLQHEISCFTNVKPVKQPPCQTNSCLGTIGAYLLNIYYADTPLLFLTNDMLSEAKLLIKIKAI